jgi:hypothetical protein
MYMVKHRDKFTLLNEEVLKTFVSTDVPTRDLCEINQN